MLRFFVVVATTADTAAAVGLQIPLWRFAAAIPFVFIASVIAITPGSIGVNELTFATALHCFGVPLAVGAQWSLANRILATAACMLVAGCAVAAHAIQQYVRKCKSRANLSPAKASCE